RQGQVRSPGVHAPLGRARQFAFLGVSIVCCLGWPQLGMASAGGRLRHLLGRGEFLANVEIHRGQNSLGEAFLVAWPFVAATEWGGQQEESEKLDPNPQSPGYDRLGRQGQILVDSEGI